jgi:putative heme degradation protein
MSKNNFGNFLSDLAKRPTAAVNSSVLDGIKAKIEAEQAAKVETRIRQIFNAIEAEVRELRSIRKKEAACKERIKVYEKQAQNIVDGKEADDLF